MSYITNLYTDPSCRRNLSTWSNGSGVNVEHIDGHFRYTNTGNNSWSIIDWNNWRELMRLGRVVVVAYTATSGLSVAVESGMTRLRHDPIGCRMDGGEDQRGRQPQHLLPWQWQFDVGGHGRVRGRRLADRTTAPPPVPVVRRRLDAPAVIGGERR